MNVDSLILFIYFDLKMMFISSSIFQMQERSALKVMLDKLSCSNTLLLLKGIITLLLLPLLSGIMLLPLFPLCGLGLSNPSGTGSP